MRLSELRRLAEDEFGPARGAMLLMDQSLSSLGSRTAAEALAEGEPPRRVWQALCEEMDVPPERRFGRDRPPSRG